MRQAGTPESSSGRPSVRSIYKPQIFRYYDVLLNLLGRPLPEYNKAQQDNT
jgi:hypothetical protein